MARTTQYKEGRATVKVVYYTSKTLADGSHPFMVRITKDRKLKYIATGLTLHPKYWNPQKKEVRKSYPEPFRNDLLNDLERWERKYSEAAGSLADADEMHDPADVVSKAIEKRNELRRATLLPYMDELILGMKRTSQLGNRQVYRTLRNQLSAFIHIEYKKDTIRFADVTVKFCNDFEVYLRERGNAETSLSNRFRTLRSVLNKAIAEGVASPETYPFSRSVSDRHKFSVSKFVLSTKKRAISRDDVRKIEAFVPQGTSSGKWSGVKNEAEVDGLQRAKDLFLFSFYVGGINFVDMAQLRWRDIQNDEGGSRLNYTRQKTGGVFSTRLLAPALSIIETYRPFTFNGPDDYIFDVLSRSVHQNPKSIANRLKKVLGQVNSDLKRIGERVGVATPLTTYVARHTMATTLRRSGVADAETSQIMGHENEKVTTIYLDSFANKTLDEKLNALL